MERRTTKTRIITEKKGSNNKNLYREEGNENMKHLAEKKESQHMKYTGVNYTGGKRKAAVQRALVLSAAAVTLGMLLFLIAYILIKGIPHLKPSLFALQYTSDNVSMFPAIVNTVIMTLLSLLIAIPFGISTAIYLTEYAKRGNKLVEAIRLTAETLAGIPSIVYGLFGLLFFVTYLGMGYSILAGSATLSIMILPLIMRTSEEALKSVPDSYREASFGLGAGKLRTVAKIVLPAAVPGILVGVILAVGRIIGETAALLYTAGTVAKLPADLFSSARTLSVHMYLLSSEGFNTDEAYATAVVLLLVVLSINTLSAAIAKKVTKV
jgi:phosphate transport system permease protein